MLEPNASVHPPLSITMLRDILVASLYDQRNVMLDKFFIKLERYTSVKREQLAYVTIVLLAVYLVLGAFAELVCNGIGFAYPAYASVKAIRTIQKDDNTYWLTYWTTFASFHLLDFCSAVIMDWVPFYWLGKCIFILYLYLPQFRGAERLYIRVVAPAVMMIESYVYSQVSAASASANIEPAIQAEELTARDIALAAKFAQ